MKSFRIISVLVIISTLITSSAAQTTNCNIRKAFIVSEGSALRFANKYGDVNVLTTKDDSLSVCATISILQDNGELVKKNMKLITINIQKLKDTVYVSTLYDKKFFSEESREGRKSFSIDYLIKLPEYININLREEFGNISIDELSGSIDIRLSQGNLNAKNLKNGSRKPVNSITADHGKIVIDNSNWIIMNLISCPSVEIGKAQALNINSTVSKISLGELSSLVCNSKSDNYKIRSVNNIVSDGIYSTYEIGRLNGQLKSTLSYGTIKISDLNKNFSGIDITSDHSQILLTPDLQASFKADISMSDGIIELTSDRYPAITKTSGSSSTSYIGFAGKDNNTKSVIRIRANNGKITVE